MTNIKKTCTTCLIPLDLGKFSPLAAGKYGVRSKCKKCNSKAARQWAIDNYDRHRDYQLQRKYGITLEEYNEILEDQGGVCAICKKYPGETRPNQGRVQGRPVRPLLAVDHDHITMEIRGLLCIPCNRGIGFLQDDPNLVRSALQYLEQI